MKNKNKVLASIFLGVSLLSPSLCLAQQYRPNSYSIKDPMAPVASRPYSIGIEGRFSSLSSSGASSGSTTTLATSGFFGWNFVNYELGPKVSFSTVSGGGTSFNTFSIGGYGDYNFVPNRIGEKFVYGLTGDLNIGQTTAAGVTGSSTAFTFGGVGKWYFAATSTSALRMTLVYSYANATTGGVSGTTSGLVFNAGFQTYF